jgi:HSP20 family protein
MAKKDDKEPKEIPKQVPAQPAPAQVVSPFEEIEHLFDDFLSRGSWIQPFLRRGLSELEVPFGSRSPKVDVIDRDTEVLVKAELPGVDKDHLDISINENLLTIRASTEHESKEEKGQYFRRELSRGEFQRTLRIPGPVEGDKAKASFSHGVLEITIPKVPGTKRQKIKVD